MSENSKSFLAEIPAHWQVIAALVLALGAPDLVAIYASQTSDHNVIERLIIVEQRLIGLEDNVRRMTQATADRFTGAEAAAFEHRMQMQIDRLGDRLYELETRRTPGNGL